MFVSIAHPGIDSSELLRATGQACVEDSLAWIIEDHPLTPGSDLRAVLTEILELPDSSDVHRAVRRICREITKSELDPASVLFELESVTPPSVFDDVVGLLAQKSPTRSLRGLTARSVIAAQYSNPATMETLCLMAGLSFRDLRERLGDEIPPIPRTHWSPKQIELAFSVLDNIIQGQEISHLPGAVPARPIELLIPEQAGNRNGWVELERLRVERPTYGLLLAQRAVGSAWGAHRNRTSKVIGNVLAQEVSTALESRRVRHAISTSVGGKTSPTAIRRMAGGHGQVGVVAIKESGEAFAGVAFAIARDGGTVRKTAGRLMKDFRSTKVPVFLVLAGPGWTHRNETGELAGTFGARLYVESEIDRLTDAVSALR